MSSYFMYTPVDKVRGALNDFNRAAVSVHHVRGEIETTFTKANPAARTYAPSGDLAIVFLGPETMMQASVSEDEESGDVTYTVTIPGKFRTPRI